MLTSKFKLTEKEQDFIEKICAEAGAEFAKVVNALMRKYEAVPELAGTLTGSLGPSIAILSAVHQSTSAVTGLMSELMLTHLQEGPLKDQMRAAMEAKSAEIARASRETAEQLKQEVLSGMFNFETAFKN